MITFDKKENIFKIETENSLYAFEIRNEKFPVHIYYGDKNSARLEKDCSRPIAFSPMYPRDNTYAPDTYMREYAGFDDGDYRTSSLKVKNTGGDSVTLLEYEGYEIFKGRLKLKGLPFAESDENTETLKLKMSDKLTKLTVYLYYTVFPKEDIISRYEVIENTTDGSVQIEKCMSLTLDLPCCDLDMISLYGSHCHERNVDRHPIFHGNQSVFSRRGGSSHQYNPFIAVCTKDCDVNKGEAYSFNFVYSGNFLDEVEVDQKGKTRINIGLGEENFSWLLEKGESFTTPEAVMTYSSAGLNKMSQNFHNFTKKRILPKKIFPQRPVVLNTWEAVYFDIDQDVLLKYADAAKECNVDMLVMDDGWFGHRDDDTSSLGDWFVNKKKFPYGLKGLVDGVKQRGIKFGIWIEPEMVNPDSEIYQKHPEWCLQAKNRTPLESRNQHLFDMGNPDVVNYLKDCFKKAFSDLGIDYFKWDFNRHLSQVGSNVLPPERQGEASFRFMLGTYELFRWLREEFPDAMIENCSGGGGRYDLGMMKYSTMIWTSDNTNPNDRIKIQHGSLLAYPASTMSCHVADRKKCEYETERSFRYNVAVGGALGYELKLPDSSEEMKEAVRKQIENYRKFEDVILDGDYYSILSPFETNYSAYYYKLSDSSKIVLYFLQQQAEDEKTVTLRVNDLPQNSIYKDELSGKEFTGKELTSGIDFVTKPIDNNSAVYFLKRIK
ncbi:MAG: alpha-galactosidase [Acutalibacteraceae bacterium]